MTTELPSVDRILASPGFNSVDRHFSRLALRLAGLDSPELALAAALVSRQLADGHAFLSLPEFAGRPLTGIAQADPEIAICPSSAEWERRLLESGVVGRPGQDQPLILDAAGRLYLHRYWRYEQAIAQDLFARSQNPPLPLDAPMLKAGLAALFPTTREQPNWQKIAAFTAVRRPLSVITGGPGTGKTWTIARVLALLLEQPGCENLQVRLAAPTGKGAARLQETLAASVESLDCSARVKTRLQARDLSATLHRLLGPIPHSSHFRHNQERPLPVDVLVIDEASMVSLALMAKLLAAYPHANTRLLLVGDKDQLPPVDPGGVFGDICRAAAINQFSQATCRAYEECTGEILETNHDLTDHRVADVAVQLQVNHRTGEAARLNRLSTTVNAGATPDVIQILKTAGPAGCPVAWRPLPALADIRQAIRETVVSHYVPVLRAAGPEEAIEALGRFRILCAVREGPYGMFAINRLVEQILARELPAVASGIRLGVYAGRPVMVTANNHTLRLYNGDTGVFWRASGGSALVRFPDDTGLLRAVAPERLPESETVYAMTVHKSQGSEFDHVLLILPNQPSPVLTRELVYTGLTRAGKSVSLWCDLALLSGALEKTAQRQSGLADALAASRPALVCT